MENKAVGNPEGKCSAIGWTSIVEKIQQARAVYECWQSTLENDVHISGLIERLTRQVMSSHEAMHALGVTDICRQCEEDEGGSCCGAGIENHYTSLLLLINLLLGISLPDTHTYPDSCYFLGPHGCRLKARHVLCVNYLCARLQRVLPHAEIIELQHMVGEELDTGFALCEAVKKMIGR